MASSEPRPEPRLVDVGHSSAGVRGVVTRWLPGISVASLVVLFQLVGLVGWADTDRFPVPTEVFAALWSEVQAPAFWEAIGASMRSWGIGLLAAVVIAVPVGALAAASRFFHRSTQFLIDFMRPIPSVALLPLFLLVFGISDTVKIVLAVVGSFFPLFFASYYGMRNVDPAFIETANAYKIGAIRRFFLVTLPASAPYIATGLRLSATIALLLVVGTEMVVGVPGLGRSIVDAQYAGRLPTMYARVMASGVVGLGVAWVFGRLEQRFLRWHASTDEGEQP